MRKIRTFNDPILKQLCKEVEYQEALGIINDMKEVLGTIRNRCVGLAAPQIGYDKRVIAICPNARLPILFMINPEIVWHTNEEIVDKEGCMSFPGIQTQVSRYRSVKVNYTTVKNRPITQLFTFYDARIVQHEMDHLNGICQVGDIWHNLQKTKQLHDIVNSTDPNNLGDTIGRFNREQEV